MRIDLSVLDWQLRGYWPYTPLSGQSVETGAAMGAVTDWMPAKVPGCVISDLLANCIIADPYLDKNSLACEWVENRWWVYRTQLIWQNEWHGQDLALVFTGIDDACHIFFNGQKLIEHEGMFEPVRLDITGMLREDADNSLLVVLESPPDEMGQIGYTSKVRSQKSRFGYKWDFATRLVHSGIWQDVYLEVTPGARISRTSVSTTVSDGVGLVAVSVAYDLSGQVGYAIEAELSLAGRICGSRRKVLSSQPAEGSASFTIRVNDPALWWPHGYGSQPLYQLVIRLMLLEDCCDQVSCETGIRSLTYAYIEGASGALPYLVRINDKQIYVRGVNLTPLDHRFGSVTEEQYARILQLARQAHVNLIRVWGGGIIEKEVFYRLCDRLGILVWQEFIQSSSGIDNVPPQDEHYLALLHRNATAAVLARRSHVSLTFWSGGNELMDREGVPVTCQNPNIAMLKTIVSEYDPQRLFLPTSASGPREFLDVSPEALGSNHDVHGPWQYQGPERHYDLYNRSDSLLHSEFGVDGFTNEQAADAFLTEQNRKLSSMKENLVWRHHGAWWDTTERDNGLFGACRTLQQQILRSQLVQAEGLRYAVEANRRRAFQNCGSIIWQFNEPWPNLSCTNLVDYYGQPKAAWWWVRRAYAPLAVSLRYNGLVCKPGEPFLAELWLSANACCYTGFVRCRLLDLAGHILFERSFKASLIDRHSARVGCIDWLARPIPHGVFLVELTADGLPDANQYLFSYEKEQPLAPLLSASAAAKVAVTEMVSGIRIENRGDVAALFIKADCRTAAFSDNCFHLLPGQNRDLTYEGDLLAGLKISWLNRSSS